MSVAHCRSSHAAPADTSLSPVGNPRLGDTPHSGCGGTPGTSEPGSPRGIPTRPTVMESIARRLSPPCQSPPISCRGGMGTISSMYAVSGGSHSDTSPRGPRDHARSGHTSEPGSPRGLPTRPIVMESIARRLSPPCQSPPTSCRGGMGTNSSIMYTTSGGNHSDTSPRGPRDHARSGPDLACYACRISSHGKSPGSNWLWCTCSRHSTSCSVSGGSPLCHNPPDPRGLAEVTRSALHSHSHVVQSPRSASSIPATDYMQPQVVEFQQVVVGTNTPFHPPQPSDLRLHPRPRSPSGLPCESAGDVNSTPKQSVSPPFD